MIGKQSRTVLRAGKKGDLRPLPALTKHHQVSEQDYDGRVLVDADLAILSSDRKEYWKYVCAIRQEYAWVSEERYFV